MSRILRNSEKREKSRVALCEAADAILTAAGDVRLTKKLYPGERDPFHGRRLTKAKQKTERTMRQQAERREKITAANVGGSRLIKKEK
jgi:hypothetical protein